MPTIIIIDGIIIQMHLQKKDHNPPHVHARYGDAKASFDIRNGKCLQGKFPSKQTKVVSKYIKEHSKELLELWKKYVSD